MNIPFNLPFIDTEESKAIIQVINSGNIKGDGPVSKEVQNILKQMLGIKNVYLTTSCTHALELALMVLEVGRGDEVILPSYTFVSTANAVVLRGATPVFVDIDTNTLNISIEDIKSKITEKTKVIIPVHYGGLSCDMDVLINIAKLNKISVVEDAAQGVDAKYKKKYLGTIGDIGCLSFHETKNIVCGEGGAFLTNNADYAKKAEIQREKGTNRSAFLKGEVDKYTWVDVGSSYVQSEILSAVLNVQLSKKEIIHEKREKIWYIYYNGLSDLEKKGIVKLSHIPEYSYPNYHMFYFMVQNEGLRDKVLDSLKKEGIQATFHYIPLHDSPFGRKISNSIHSLKNTENCSKTLIRLPLYPSIVDEAEKIIAITQRILNSL